MFERICEALYRQSQALNVLTELLDEEYQLLIHRDTDAIVALEFSIHELIRQIANEKNSVITFLGGGKLSHYAEMLPSEDSTTIKNYFKMIDISEQACSKKASVNAKFSLVLLDQSRDTFKELQSQSTPKVSQTYGRRGVMQVQRPQASFYSGRL